MIAGYARSPFQPAHKGSLARVRPDELAAQVVAGLIERTRVDPQAIEDLIVGCAFPEGEQGLNVARLIGFLAGLPERVAGHDRQPLLRLVDAGGPHGGRRDRAWAPARPSSAPGVESMTRVPIMGFNPMPNPGLAARVSPGLRRAWARPPRTSPAQHQITRARAGGVRRREPRKAAAAQAAGRLADEIVPIAQRRRDDRAGRLHPRRTPPSKRWPS